MKARPTQSRKGVKGQLPLAESRDSVPCGVWGNAPTVPRATSMLNALNKGAGSEASLPVTLRSRRSAPRAALPPRFREEPYFLCARTKKGRRNSFRNLPSRSEPYYSTVRFAVMPPTVITCSPASRVSGMVTTRKLPADTAIIFVAASSPSTSTSTLI